jgi:hypothetical protein
MRLFGQNAPSKVSIFFTDTRKYMNNYTVEQQEPAEVYLGWDLEQDI